MTIDEEYKGCRNCKYQPEPLQTCDWLKHQKKFYIVCPMWELKESKMERMTIDEAIILLKNHKCLLKREEDRIAEWLEELKDLQEMKETIECNAEVLEQQGYDKAVYDFDKWFQDKMQFGYVHIDQWNEYIEQLKAGVKE